MPRTYAYHIAEMDCADEVRQLKEVLLPLVGNEEKLSFDLMRARLTVTLPDSDPSDDNVRKAVAKTGMNAVPWAEAVAKQGQEDFWTRRGRTILVLAGSALILAAYILHAIAVGPLQALTGESSAPVLSILFYVLAAILGGWYFAPKAWLSLKRMSPDMNLLMTIAILGAMLLGEWFEAASVSVLFAFSLLLERWSVGRARRAVESLLSTSPQSAAVVVENGVEERPVEQVGVGTLIRVAPGQRIPLDGIVISGISELDTSPITGESIPQIVEVGQEVFAGSINGSGALEIETTKLSDNTLFARILRLVEAARSKRSPSERWVDKFARVYTPVMFALAALVAVGGPLLFDGTFTEWVYRALVLLVIACPCALVIATPVAVVAGLTSASRAGVLVKGGDALEGPAHLKAIAFDKTGTLTEGLPQVIHGRVLHGKDQDRVIALAAGLEARGTHPLAHAIVNFALEQEIEPLAVESLQQIPGVGMMGVVNGKDVLIGGPKLLEGDEELTSKLASELEEFHQRGATAVVLLEGRQPLAIFAIADAPRREAAQAVATLRKLDIHEIVMLSGDHPLPARAVAEEVGITDVRAGLLPEEKLAAIEELEERWGGVMMVGDGINDAPSLARATVSVAMGAAGADAALETADITLMSSDLKQLPWLIEHSRRTFATVRTNIMAALAVKAIFLLFAAFDLTTLWMAVAADMGTSLLVTANALRLLTPDKRTGQAAQ